MRHSYYRPRPSALALVLAQALAIGFAAPAIAQTSDAPAVSLKPVNITGKAPVTLDATESAPSQSTLDAVSAISIVSDNFIRNFTSPVSDYTQVVSMAPGVFSYSANGVGLTDSKITMRGLPDSYFLMSFDGIPFNDTNGVSHHSWVFFPSQYTGGAVVDRSPGSAATIGQATFGGSIDLLSRVLEPEQRTSVTGSVGTWNTTLTNFEHETGQFGVDGSSNLLFNIQDMKSNGYETYNKQDRFGYSAKYQQTLVPGTVLTAVSAYVDLGSNTPSLKGITRTNYNAGNYTALMSGDPTQANYWGYNFYTVKTSFNYVGIASDLGNGWKLDDKAYRYGYDNHENYNGTTITATSAIDKLNSYNTFGNILRLSKDSSFGTLRTGLWLEQADSHRYQIPSSPTTWVDSATPNFNESYITRTIQPYLEYAFKVDPKLTVTPGLKFASYSQSFNHVADNGGAVGPLGGTYNSKTGVITGGAGTYNNGATYKDWLPSLSANYKITPEWSAYAQYAVGDEIPSSSVFDTSSTVNPLPKSTRATTFQFGSVYQSKKMSLSADFYHTKLDGAYSALPPDQFGNVAYVFSGNEYDQGVEAEGNFVLGSGFSIYVNGTVASLKYANGQWVAGAPKDTETVALNYQRDGWGAMLSVNRVGTQYNDSKSGVHEAFTLAPITVTNLFLNYTLKEPYAFVKKTKFQFSVNNLTNQHSITAIAPVSGSSGTTPSNADLLTVLAGRSLNATVTLDF